MYIIYIIYICTSWRPVPSPTLGTEKSLRLLEDVFPHYMRDISK